MHDHRLHVQLVFFVVFLTAVTQHAAAVGRHSPDCTLVGSGVAARAAWHVAS